MRIVEARHGLLEIQVRMTPRWMHLAMKAPAACRDSRLDNAHVVPTLHRIYLHVHETWKGRFARARARTAVAWFETKFRIKFRIIFQNICITFPLCSREHASSILESIAASALVAGRTFSLREGIRVHKVARSPTSVCVRCCDYPAGIRVSKGNSSKRLCSFQISTRYASFLKANVRGNSPNQVPKMSARYGSWMFYMTEPGSVSIFRAFP